MVGVLSTLNGIKNFFMQPDVAGQFIAQAPKMGFGLISTELGNKILNGVIGTIGNVINEKFNKGKYKVLARAALTNMMTTPFDPTVNQIMELKRNVRDLVGGMKAHNFSASFGAIFEEPHKIVGAVKSLIPSKMGFNLGSLKGMFARKSLSITSDNTVKSISPETVSVYRGLGGKLTEKDLVGY